MHSEDDSVQRTSVHSTNGSGFAERPNDHAQGRATASVAPLLRVPCSVLLGVSLFFPTITRQRTATCIAKSIFICQYAAQLPLLDSHVLRTLPILGGRPEILGIEPFRLTPLQLCQIVFYGIVVG